MTDLDLRSNLRNSNSICTSTFLKGQEDLARVGRRHQGTHGDHRLRRTNLSLSATFRTGRISGHALYEKKLHIQKSVGPMVRTQKRRAGFVPHKKLTSTGGQSRVSFPHRFTYIGLPSRGSISIFGPIFKVKDRSEHPDLRIAERSW